MKSNYITSYRPAAGGKIRALWLTVCVFGLAAVASAGQPRFITFDAPGAGTGPFQGTGCFFSDCYVLLNDLGEITGYYMDVNNVVHGFIRSPEGKFTTFDAPGADTSPQPSPFSLVGTIPTGINDAGAITGYYVDASGNDHGFLRSPEGVFTTFDVTGGIVGTTVPIALNLEGAIVGYDLDQNGVFNGWLRRPDGTFTMWVGPGGCDISPANGCYGTGALAINVLGTISGHDEDNSGNFVSHVLVRSAQGKFSVYTDPAAGTAFDTGTGCPACATPINLFGAIAGLYIDQNYVVHGFLRGPEGAFTNFDVPGAGPSGIDCFADCVLGLNDWGAITGFYPDANSVWHGFVRSPEGTITSFDAPGADETIGDNNGTYAYSINDAGVITGSYQDSNNVFHGFVMLPGGF